MGSGTLWLALDVGTTGTKAALVASDGRIVRGAYRGYPTHTADNGVMEQDAADWWTAAVKACRELAAYDEIKQVEAIAVTGQMQDVILVDADGNPIRPVILYSDTRARSEAEEVQQRLGVDRLRSLTGNDQDAGGLLAKLLWLKRHQPDGLAAARHLLMGAADFITLKMAGVAITDTTTASTTGLLNITDRLALSRFVLDEISIGDAMRLLPTISNGGTRAGTLVDAAAGALGLKGGILVYHGPGDAGAATLGAGSGEAGQVYAYLGTSGWIAFTSSERGSPDQGVITLAHPRPNHYIQIAPLLTAGGNLEWIRNMFEADDYDGLIDRALQRPPSALLYLPYLNGERSPFRDPLARGAWVGLTGRTQQADLHRAVLEGVAYAYRHALSALLVSPTNALTISGGGTRSEGWCQLFADILNVPVHLAGDAENVGVRGVVLAARVASGEVDSYTPAGYFPIAGTFQPASRYRAHFDRQYVLFRDAYPALRPIFARMV